MDQGYLLGIGSNLAPEANVPRMLVHLVRRFGAIALSRFYETVPVGMESERQFINFCAFIATDLEPEACKAACVEIEVALGRDRTHPSRKVRDRAADIDLLAHAGADGLWDELPILADYFAQPAAELLAVLSPGYAVPRARGLVRGFVVGEARLGEAPATIHRDDRTGLIVVREDRLHGEADRLDPAFLAQQRLCQHALPHL